MQNTQLRIYQHAQYFQIEITPRIAIDDLLCRVRCHMLGRGESPDNRDLTSM